MQLEKKTVRRVISLAIIAILLIFTSVVLYFQLWKKPVEVNSGLAKHHLTFTEHSDTVWRVMFSPDGERIASGSVDGTVKIWRIRDGQVQRTLEHPTGVTGLAY